MNPFIALFWHFAGLAAASAGAFELLSWPGVFIVIGSWAVLATLFDLAVQQIGRR